MSTAESPAHLNLKRLALIWAQQHGYRAVALEVRLPKSAYRADLAGYKHTPRGVGTTVVFECKQARSDLLKDSYPADATSQRLAALDERRRTLEKLLKVHQPSLRAGESLFAEYDSIDATKLEHKTYRRVMHEIAILQRRLLGKTKFDRLTAYRCANLNYLVVEEGVVAAGEVPLGWGLLVHQADAVVLERKPVWQEVAEQDRLLLLQRIAIAGTRTINRQLGIHFEEIKS
jgi:hypothetical protein